MFHAYNKSYLCFVFITFNVSINEWKNGLENWVFSYQSLVYQSFEEIFLFISFPPNRRHTSPLLTDNTYIWFRSKIFLRFQYLLEPFVSLMIFKQIGGKFVTIFSVFAKYITLFDSNYFVNDIINDWTHGRYPAKNCLAFQLVFYFFRNMCFQVFSHKIL